MLTYTWFVFRCLKKFTSTIRSSTGAGNNSTDEFGDQQRLLRKMSFFPREEANMPFDFKVCAWLDLLFASVDVDAAPEVSYFFPGTASDTASENEKRTVKATGSDNEDNDDDEIAREQRKWLTFTRASIEEYRSEPEPKLTIQEAYGLLPAWHEDQKRLLKKSVHGLVHKQTEPHQQLSHSLQKHHQPKQLQKHQQQEQQKQRQYQICREQSQSPYLQLSGKKIAPAREEEYCKYNQDPTQFESHGIYYSTELNVPLKRCRFGSLGAIGTRN